MTTPWKITTDWQGQTVAVLASGTTMSPELAESLRGFKTIVVNYTCRAAPWADMLVALDGNWDDELRAFEGMRVAGVDDPDHDALYAGPFWERVQIAPGNEIEFRNSGVAAIRIAALMGASNILLAGFDPDTQRHWYDDEVDTGEYVGLSQAVKALIEDLIARGVVVEFIGDSRV
jgi:hypothetical protein